MRCSTAQKWVSQYIDGDLDSKRQALLKKHTDGCQDCRKLMQDFHEIVGHAGDISDPPPRDTTWGRIQARLEQAQGGQQVPAYTGRERRIVPRWGYALAAALLLVAVGAVTLGPRLMRSGPMLAELDRQQYTLTKLEEAEVHYQKAIKALAEAVSAQGEQIDPKLAEVFKTNLDIVNASIADCKLAVMSHPEDLDSRRFLLAAYKKKADLYNIWMNVQDESSPLGSFGNTL
ncbi:MAG: zf-HC2 domain-containing protein [Candidatus Aminicenantaceae bacterium]